MRGRHGHLEAWVCRCVLGRVSQQQDPGMENGEQEVDWEVGLTQYLSRSKGSNTQQRGRGAALSHMEILAQLWIGRAPPIFPFSDRRRRGRPLCPHISQPLGAGGQSWWKKHPLRVL